MKDGLKKSAKDAVLWMQQHGGDAAMARTAAGGNIVLAQGETGPFMVATQRVLVEAGLAEWVIVNKRKTRFRLTESGRNYRG